MKTQKAAWAIGCNLLYVCVILSFPYPFFAVSWEWLMGCDIQELGKRKTPWSPPLLAYSGFLLGLVPTGCGGWAR